MMRSPEIQVDVVWANLTDLSRAHDEEILRGIAQAERGEGRTIDTDALPVDLEDEQC